MADDRERPAGAGGQPTPSLADFLGEPTRDLAAWRWLWEGDRRFPIRSHRGLLGRLLVFGKRLLRPFVQVPQNDLWERQRVFNLIVLEHVERLTGVEARARANAEQLSWHEGRLERLEAFWREGLHEVMRHNDALFARVDQKLDRLRREGRDLWGRLGAALAIAERGASEPLARVREEQAYLALEARFRGTEEEIGERVSVYLPRLPAGEVLDLGCGRGEWLALLRESGRSARGVDANAEMVAECRGKALVVEEGDLFAALAGAAPASLGTISSFHVIEHLNAPDLDRLLRLAYRALSPGGLLLLETPNPLSLAVGARSFWLDPTHQRPVHPETLALLCDQAGFDSIERLELHPFPASERLPEIDLAQVAPEQRLLADQVNRLRDQLDALLFGSRDYALLAWKVQER